METTTDLRSAVSDWQAAANAAIAAARRGAALTLVEMAGGSFDETQANRELAPTGDPEGAVDGMLAAGDRIIELLPGELEEDVDAATRALALFAGSLAVVDTIAGATEPPEAIRAERRLRTFWEYGRVADADVDFFAGVLLGAPSGGSDGPRSTAPRELTRLGEGAGHETVSLASSVIVNSTLDSLIDGLRTVFDVRHATGAFADVMQALAGFLNRFKRAATRLVQWIAERALKLLPRTLAEVLKEKISDGVLSLSQVDHLVGAALVDLFGANEIRARWKALPAQPPPGVDRSVVQPYLDHIGWIAAGRRAIDRWGGNVVLDLARTVGPSIQVAYYIVVAVAILFVGTQAGMGVRALDRAVP
jgi:hypothetical protein